MAYNQQIIESKSYTEPITKIFNFTFLKSDQEMLSSNSALNYHLKTSDLSSRPLLKNRVKLYHSFKKTTEPVKKPEPNNLEKASIDLLTATGIGHKAESVKSLPSPNKMSNRRKCNLSRARTQNSRLNKNFDSTIDGRSISEFRQNCQTTPNFSTEQTSNQKLPDINFYLPNLPINANYSSINTNKELLNELKDCSRKTMSFNQNSIKRIRKLLNLDGFTAFDNGPRPKLPNRPKMKTPPLFQPSFSEKQDINELVLSITHLKPSPVNTYTSIDGEKRKVSETPVTKSSLSTRDNENKYADYYYFEQSHVSVNEPMRITFSDKAPPSTPQAFEEQCYSLNEECKCLLCEKEALLKEKYIRRLRKKQEKKLKESSNFETSENLLPYEVIDKNIAECLSKNVQYSSSHPIISVTVKK